MKVSRLIEQHRKYQDQGLADNFGDGYLMTHNQIYRQVRESALALGYRFSSERNDAYETFPLLQLEALLQDKVLPYSNNMAAFVGMTTHQLETISWEDIDGNLKRNFVFHEACHGVARTLALQTLGNLPEGDDTAAQRYRAVRMLLEESCANTCEFLGAGDAVDSVHRALYEMNSYVCEFENRTNIKKAMTEIGGRGIVKFMILSYLHSNFLRENIDDRAFEQMLKTSFEKDLVVHQKKTLRALAKISFYLSERFRVQTTSFHLRLAGVKTPIYELFDFDFLGMLLQDKKFSVFLEEFAQRTSG